jgi:hypothetical protein
MTKQPEPPAPASRAGSLVAAAVAGLVLVALLIGIGWWRAGQDAAVLATGLPSGLPVGRLEGSVDYDDLDLDDGRTGRIHFFYVVNEDGTGTFRPPGGHSEDPWPVRYAGRTPGQVRVMSDNPFCGGQTTDVSLDFRSQATRSRSRGPGSASARAGRPWTSATWSARGCA